MKTDIHPTYYPEAIAKCACGNTFTVGSTMEKIHTEVCGACHPFYTGKEKLMDSMGQVQKFKERASQKKTGTVSKRVKKIQKRQSRAKKAE